MECEENKLMSPAQDYPPLTDDDSGNVMDSELECPLNSDPLKLLPVLQTEDGNTTAPSRLEMIAKQVQVPDNGSTTIETSTADESLSSNPKMNQTLKKLEYAKAVMSLKEIGIALPCQCKPKNPTKAIKIPVTEAVSYRSVVEKLLPYGHIEAISLNPYLKQHTIVFECGCQASKATNSSLVAIGPFIPPPDLVSQYNPRKYNNHCTNCQDSPRISQPPLPSFPQFFRVKAKGNPSIVDIIAYLTQEIGEIPPNNITRVKDSFNIKIEKDAQSLMIMLMDFSKSNVIQEVYPHPELNCSKAVCHSRELYQTNTETIKLHSSPKVKEVHQIKSSYNTTIITFPTSQPPTKIDICGITFNLDRYIEKPKQCNRCFSYMHTSNECRKSPRCGKCSDLKSNHSEETCNKTPYCILCKDDHPPTSSKCQVYLYEEDLLNEALSRGCGRGYIRAERRRAANIQERTNQGSAPTQTNPSNIEKRKDDDNNDNMLQPQPSPWIEQKGRSRKRNGKKNRPTILQVPETPTFELPEAYSRKDKVKHPEQSSHAELSDQEDPIISHPHKDTVSSVDDKSLKITQEETGNLKESPLLSSDLDPESPSSSTNTAIAALSPCPQLLSESREEIGELVRNEPLKIPLEDTPSLKEISCSPVLKTSSVKTKTSLPPTEPTPSSLTKTMHSEPNQDLAPQQNTVKPQLGTRRKNIQTRPLSSSPPISNQQEPPCKKGKKGSPNSQDDSESSPKNNSSKKQKRCIQCSITYKTIKCLKDHQTFFHPKKSDFPKIEPVPNHESVKFAKDHLCAKLPHEQCKTLYEIRKNNVSNQGRGILVDSKGAIYNSISDFRRRKPYSFLKKANQEKIYGPPINKMICEENSKTTGKRRQQTEYASKNDQSSNLQKKPQWKTQTMNPKQQKKSPGISPLQTSDKEAPCEGSFVKDAVARLEGATCSPMDRTWPGIQNFPSAEPQYLLQRDPRLRRRSSNNLDNLKSPTFQTQNLTLTLRNDNEQMPQNNPLIRSGSIDSLYDYRKYPIQTIISSRW